MSDPEDAQNDANEELDNDNNDQNDYDEPAVVTAPDSADIASSSTTTVSSAGESSSSPLPPSDEDYDDGPLEDYVVKLVVNGEPDSSTSVKDLLDAGITDRIGDLPSKTSAVIDAINGYTSTIVDELAGNGTAITGEGKAGWLGWSWRTWLYIGLAILCIIGIVAGLLFCLLGKNFGKNKRSQTSGSGTTTTTKAVVTKGISTDQRYQQVPNV